MKMNKVILMGRLTKEPETKYSQSSEPIAVTRIGVAVSREGKKDEADFINCTAFRKTAEFIAKYFKKGQQILLQGSLRIEPYTDSSGNKRTSTEVIIEKVEFVGSKADNSSVGTSAKVADNENDFYSVEGNVDEDSLPF